MDLTITGGSVLCPDGRLIDAAVTIARGLITEVGEPAPGLRTLGASGRMVVSGFVDLQCNGALGIDLGSEPERLWELAAALPRWGVTAWLPTIVTGPADVRDRALAALAARPDDFIGAEPLGLHLEGPFIAPDRLGAHPARHRLDPDPALASGWSRSAGVAMVTLAPELPGSLALAAELVDRGVVVSAGHSAATYDEAMAAFDAGVTSITHLFNAMSGVHHRQPGLAGAALVDDRVAVGLIVDGHHVHPAMVRASIAALGDRLVLVTDAVAALGVGDASDDDTVRLADGTLAGSLLPMDRAVANACSMGSLDPTNAVRAATETPAALLGDRTRGRLEPGCRGDVVVLDGSTVVATVIGGAVVYERS